MEYPEFRTDTVVVTVDGHDYSLHARTTTTKRTEVQCSAGSAAQTFLMAAAWLRDHPDARPILSETTYGGRHAYETDQMFILTMHVAWHTNETGGNT